jgi:pimeloyl-ACP methyl ester carboxylesterase
MSVSCKELTFHSRELKIASQSWGDQSSPLLLALHGWLDNSASFAVLAPLLAKKFYVVALDLPGQGLSDKRDASATYHLWDDMVDVANIIEQLGKEKINLLGHSRGAMLSVMISATFPERINSLHVIDGLMPLPEKVEDTATQLRKYVNDFQKQAKNRRFKTRDEAILARAMADRIEESLAEQLAQRQLVEDDRGWYWNADERLKHASAIKMTDARNEVLLTEVKAPVQVFLASKGMASYPKMKEYQALFNHFEWMEVEGHHHLHMIPSSAQNIAEKILSNSDDKL